MQSCASITMFRTFFIMPKINAITIRVTFYPPASTISPTLANGLSTSYPYRLYSQHLLQIDHKMAFCDEFHYFKEVSCSFKISFLFKFAFCSFAPFSKVGTKLDTALSKIIYWMKCWSRGLPNEFTGLHYISLHTWSSTPLLLISVFPDLIQIFKILFLCF